MGKTTARLYLYALSMLLAIASCSSPPPEEQAAKRINEIMDDLNAVGLSVAVVRDGETVYAKAFGRKSLESGAMLDENDIFRIASISKTFTATAIMQLRDAGKFELDDDISGAFGIPVRNPDYPETPVTYRMLLSHTSSMSDRKGYFTYDVVDPEKNEEYEKVYNDYIPGSKYEYCNLGYNILGALVELHSGERFDKYIRNHITEPLGLYAGFNVAELDSALFVPLYNYDHGRFILSTDAYANRASAPDGYLPGRSTTLFSPTGGMKIAPKDLAKHMLAQINGGACNGVEILDAGSVSEMQAPYEYEGKTFDYGLGIATTQGLIQGERMKGHTGSAYGLYSAMFFEPEKKFGFVVMTNGYPEVVGGNGFQRIQSDVINALYDLFIKGRK